MLRLFKSKWFIMSLVTIIILVVMGVSAGRNSKLNWLSNIISVPLTPVQSLFSSIGHKVGDGLAYFGDIKKIRDENKELQSHVNELESENRVLSSYKSENEDLRKALELKSQFDHYSVSGGNIIAIDPGNWFNIFKIDIGSKDGVKIDSPVVTSDKGLVGRILSSDITSSKVLTIIDEESAVAGWISNTGGGHVIVRGDILLKERGYCRADNIPLDVVVTAGDVIETSGLGGIFPKGIIIGKVIEVRKTSSEMDRYAIIQPAADFKRLEEVYVLKQK